MAKTPRPKRVPAAKAPRRAAAALIVISNRQKAMRVPTERLRRLIRFVARQEGRQLAAVDLTIVAADEITVLNRNYLCHDRPTDVLSFDMSESERAGISAQLVVCGEVAARQARHRGHSAARELMLYVVHALLHLMDYEDHSIRGAARMHAREDEILSAFGEGPAYMHR